MRPAKHLIEKALPQLCRVNPVVRLEFLPEYLNDVGRSVACVKQNVPAGRFIEAGQAVKDGGFASAVWADKGGNRTALHVEIDVIKRLDPTKMHHQVLYA